MDLSNKGEKGIMRREQFIWENNDHGIYHKRIGTMIKMDKLTV
jgi:hypothetical protein